MKNVLVNAALVVGSTLLTLVLVFGAGEVLLRWQYGAVPPGPPIEWNRYDERRGWALRPGDYSYFDVRAARRVDVALNAQGLRNGPLAPEPRPGVERVTVLGDSFIFGAPLQVEYTIPARLQALAGSDIEVVNMAVPGYGTGQQFLLMKELLASGYRMGSKVVLTFFTNDLQDNLGLEYATLARNSAQPAFHVDSNGTLQQSPINAPPAHEPTSTNGWRARSLFAHFLRSQVEVLAVTYPALWRASNALGIAPNLPRTPGIIAGWYGPQWETRWAVTEDVLEHVIEALRSMPEAPDVSIVFIPSPFQVHEAFRSMLAANAQTDVRFRRFLSDPDRPQRLVQSVARRLDVPFIDLTPALRQAANGSVLYFPREGHFNEAGSALAAEVIYRHLFTDTEALSSVHSRRPTPQSH